MGCCGEVWAICGAADGGVAGRFRDVVGRFKNVAGGLRGLVKLHVAGLGSVGGTLDPCRAF